MNLSYDPTPHSFAPMVEGQVLVLRWEGGERRVRVTEVTPNEDGSVSYSVESIEPTSSDPEDA